MLSYSIISMMIIACQSKAIIKPTYNKGGYTMSCIETKSRNAVVFGQIKDIETNEIIRSAIVKMGCLTVQSDDLGEYKISGESIPMESFLTCFFIGYRAIETQRFKLETGDSLKIDFF